MPPPKRDRDAAGDEEGDAAGDRERPEGGDERVDVEPGEEPAVDRADERAGAEAGEERELLAAGRPRHPGGDDGGEADHRADREVEPARDDDERLAERDDGDDRGLAPDVEQVARRQEELVGEGQEHDQRDDHQRDRGLALPEQRPRPSPSAWPRLVPPVPRRPPSESVLPELTIEEGLRTRHVVLAQVLDDDRDVRVLLREPPEVEVVVERPEARRRQLDLADAAEGVALERVRVADVGVLLRLVVARALDVLGVGDPDLVGERVEDLVQDPGPSRRCCGSRSSWSGPSAGRGPGGRPGRTSAPSPRPSRRRC